MIDGNGDGDGREKGRKGCRDVSGKYHWPKENSSGRSNHQDKTPTKQTLKNQDEISLSSIKRYNTKKKKIQNNTVPIWRTIKIAVSYFDGTFLARARVTGLLLDFGFHHDPQQGRCYLYDNIRLPSSFCVCSLAEGIRALTGLQLWEYDRKGGKHLPLQMYDMILAQHGP